MSDIYIILLLFAVMWLCFGLSLWLLFRPQKTDPFEDLRLAFKDVERAVGKEIEPILLRLSQEITRLMERAKP